MTGWAVQVAPPSYFRDRPEHALVVFIRAKIFTRFTYNKARQESHYCIAARKYTPTRKAPARNAKNEYTAFPPTPCHCGSTRLE